MDIAQYDSVVQKRRALTYEDLTRIVASAPPDLVEGLLTDRSVNMLVGDSNLGKTPLAVMLGIAVASGRPFLGRQVRQGSVLYCDGETSIVEMHRMLEAISEMMELRQPPLNFYLYSLNAPEEEGVSTGSSPSQTIFGYAADLKPALVIVDPLRVFWPYAQDAPDKALLTLTPMREASKAHGCSWVILHHRRKHSRDGEIPPLATDPHGWFQEAAGTQALTNHTDARLGVESSNRGNADLLLAGFVRSKGKIPPMYLTRRYDIEREEPVGYDAVAGLALLNENYQQTYSALPARFRFVQAKDSLGNSGSNATSFLWQCMSAGLLRRDGKEYVKVARS